MTTQNISLSIPTLHELREVYKEIKKRYDTVRGDQKMFFNKIDELETLDFNTLRNRIREIDPLADHLKEAAQKVITYANQQLPQFEEVPQNQISHTEHSEWEKLISLCNREVMFAKHDISMTDGLVTQLTKGAGDDPTLLIQEFKEDHK